jgi:hypothetical protein
MKTLTPSQIILERNHFYFSHLFQRHSSEQKFYVDIVLNHTVADIQI